MILRYALLFDCTRPEETFNGLIFSNKTVKTEAEQPQRCHRRVKCIRGCCWKGNLRSSLANGKTLDSTAAISFYDIHISDEINSLNNLYWQTADFSENFCIHTLSYWIFYYSEWIKTAMKYFDYYKPFENVCLKRNEVSRELKQYNWKRA